MQILKKRRITVTITPDIEIKVRSLQAEIILQTSRSTSFSSVLNQILNEAFKAQLNTRVHEHFSPGLDKPWI